MAKMRTAKAGSVPLDSFGFHEQHAWTKAWRVPIDHFDHHVDWRSWKEYFAAYELVREEMLARAADGECMAGRLCAGKLPFAEVIRAEVLAAGADAVYEVHLHAALLHSHVCRFGDQHVHAEWRLDPPLRFMDGTLYHGQIQPAVEVREESVWPR